MSSLSYLTDAGVHAEVVGENLKLKGLSKLPDDRRENVIQYAKRYKLDIIAALSQSPSPGQCESCPAAGYWDHNQYAGVGLVCFHDAYFLHKSGSPMPCTIARGECPRLP